MKIMVNLSENFIDVWNEEKEIWERYAKVSLAPEEENKIPKKLYGILNPKEGTTKVPNNEQLMFKVNEIIDYLDYLKSKGE